jgi:uncharacterized surface protein with fasciclin (FAS1) repeats
VRKHISLATVVGMVCLSTFLSGCATENKAPTADFSYDAIFGTYIGKDLPFRDNSTDEDGTIVSWDWDFGDNATSAEQNPTHVFEKPGTYTVSLTVTDNDGVKDTITRTIEITKKDIVVTAAEAGTFDTLVAALITTDLIETLKGEGPFTMFAPTDEAFDLLNQTYLTDLFNDIDTLTNVLSYHVISGKIMSTDLIDGMTATTLEGSEIIITINMTGCHGYTC